jgi:hypothetical protein
MQTPKNQLYPILVLLQCDHAKTNEYVCVSASLTVEW